ncbi:hypothetical protein [Isoptericola sediminis]|uniref:Uncharacterized protein n=1 Tax=Isoptericola sediminis TaxID=2733572 RepID=A0A849K1X3_9MICO|nr:hypothetical protein [Isoptericola sediminis]NNU26731.1 hypothetical protein [Isoptericola sediminis]
MPRRRHLLTTAALLPLLTAGCAGPEPGSASACAAPELTWATDTAAAGDAVALHGEGMHSGCEDGSGDTEEPFEFSAASLVVDGEPVEPGPAIPGTLAASEDGTFDMQVALPPDLAEGAQVTVELTVTEGASVVSDALTIGG